MALQEAVRRRAELYEALLELEKSLSAPVPGREAVWRRELCTNVATLENDFRAHVRVTEGNDGLSQEILTAAPHLSSRVEVLKREHTQLRDAIVEYRELAESRSPGSSDPLTDVRKAGLALLSRLSRHRQGGSDLVYQAFQVDIGVTD